MVKLIATKPLTYRTRRLLPGDEFEATPRWAKCFKGVRRAKDAPPAPVVEAPPMVETEPVLGIEGMTRDELLDLAKERGVELPNGYVRRDELLALLGADG